MDAKKAVLALLVVFLGFWMFTDPRGLADAAGAAGSGGWSLLTQVFDALIRFVGAL